MHNVRVTCRSGGVREGSQALLRTRQALAGKRTLDALQQLRPILPAADSSSG